MSRAHRARDAYPPPKTARILSSPRCGVRCRGHCRTGITHRPFSARETASPAAPDAAPLLLLWTSLAPGVLTLT